MENQNPQIKKLVARIKSLEALVKSQAAEIADLKSRLNKNSRNSSRPPSSDGLSKPPSKNNKNNASLRLKGKNKTGGQNGHFGSTLSSHEKPDKVIRHDLMVCPNCAGDLSNVAHDATQSRQVFDIPEPSVEVTEHQIEIKHCPSCGHHVRSNFPKGVEAPVQYGSTLKSWSTYLQHQHFIPEARLQDIFSDLFHIKICPASLATFSSRLHKHLSEFESTLLDQVKKAKVKHLDETGFRISGKTQWLHVASNGSYTYYHVSPKRKSLLTDLKGTVIHDYWRPYFQLDGVTHGLCNAHHLRELNARIEEKERWAHKMRRLLYYGYRLKCVHGAQPIPPEKLNRYIKLYKKIVDQGIAYHKSKSPLPSGSRGRKKRRPGHNFLIRLRDRWGDVLRFLTDPDVPFTNNQAERDLRMMKCKQKISGGFRSNSGAEQFARIRGFISTAKKQGWNILESLRSAIDGNVPKFS